MIGRRQFLRRGLLGTGALLVARYFPAAYAASARLSAVAPTSPLVPGKFVDRTAESGIDFVNVAFHTPKKYLLETMGSGVALFDYDNDGRLDVFLVNGAPLSDPTPKGTIPKKNGPRTWNRLYHQREDGKFEDVTEKAGVQGTGFDFGVAVADYDNDGLQDFLVTGFGHNTLYHNNGDGTFTDVTKQAGVAGSGWSSSAVWFDYDNDGLLDLLVERYLNYNFEDLWCGQHLPGYRGYCSPDLFPAISPLLYHNDGNGHFTDVTRQAGMGKPGRGLGVAINDAMHDGRMDVMVANDSMVEFFYHNNGDGTFSEQALIDGLALDGSGATYAGMGVDFADYNNDGNPDIIITDLSDQRYALYENNGDGTFTYATDSSGIGRASLLQGGWGVKFFDYDNDGWKDLLIAQGHDMITINKDFPQLHYRQPMMLLRNTGKKFVNVSKESGEVFSKRLVGRGLAIGDLNNDGLIDAVVETNDGPAYVLYNETPTKNHWLTMLLVGYKSNRDAIGAQVKLTTSSGPQYVTVTTGGSYLSSSDKRVHFGLGKDPEAKSIEIRWPSGIVQKLENVPGDRIIKIDEPVSGKTAESSGAEK